MQEIGSAKSAVIRAYKHLKNQQLSPKFALKRSLNTYKRFSRRLILVGIMPSNELEVSIIPSPFIVGIAKIKNVNRSSAMRTPLSVTGPN